MISSQKQKSFAGEDGGSYGKESAAKEETQELQVGFLSPGRSPGEGNDNPIQYSCLENPMDRGG